MVNPDTARARSPGDHAPTALAGPVAGPQLGTQNGLVARVSLAAGGRRGMLTSQARGVRVRPQPLPPPKLDLGPADSALPGPRPWSPYSHPNFTSSR